MCTTGFSLTSVINISEIRISKTNPSLTDEQTGFARFIVPPRHCVHKCLSNLHSFRLSDTLIIFRRTSIIILGMVISNSACYHAPSLCKIQKCTPSPLSRTLSMSQRLTHWLRHKLKQHKSRTNNQTYFTRLVILWNYANFALDWIGIRALIGFQRVVNAMYAIYAPQRVKCTSPSMGEAHTHKYQVSSKKCGLIYRSMNQRTALQVYDR